MEPAESRQVLSSGVVRLCHDLANASSLASMFTSVVQALVDVTGVRRASALTFDDGGVMRFRASHGLSEGYRARVDGHSPWTQDTVDARPILVGDVQRDASMQELHEVFEKEGIRALAFLPIAGGGRLLGKFMLYADAPTDWSQKDLPFAGAAADLLASFLMRERAQERLLQARKMESLGLLAGGIAHDFNNLLTSILGYVDLIRQETLRGTPARTYVDDLLQTAEHAAELTKQLLGFARPQAVAMEMLDLVAFVEEARGSLQRFCGSRHELLVELAPGVPLVRASRAQMHQLLMNLVGNARDAMPDGGSIRVRVRPNVIAQGVELEVVDTGMGMDEDTRRRVFEPLFTTKQVGRGTGLGLATCYAIVTSFGGDIAVRSAPGRGTSFVVALPSMVSAPESAPRAPSPLATVLLVDDQEHVARALQRSLEKMQYRVLVANSGPAAITLFGTERIDIVVSDVVMPGMSGVELAERLQSKNPALPILLITGFVDASHHLPPHLSVLGKPFLPRELGQRVASLLGPARIEGGGLLADPLPDQTLSGS